MNIGMNIFYKIPVKKQVELFHRYGVKRTFWSSEKPEFEEDMRLFRENGIICETLHAPYRGINSFWGEDEEAAQAMMLRLKDCIDKCARHEIPVAVVHLSEGRPMPAITERGVARFEELFAYAEEKGIRIALENLKYLENLSYFMDRYKTPGFCWDCGHQYCFMPRTEVMDLYGDRLIALHIHDNRCGDDTDDHLIPFDGNIPFEQVARKIAESGYEGTLMLEIGKYSTIDGVVAYADTEDEEYVRRAAEGARRIADMVEDFKREICAKQA